MGVGRLRLHALRQGEGRDVRPPGVAVGRRPLRNPADVRRGRARARPDQYARRRSRTRGTGRGGQTRRAGGRREMPGHRRRRAARAELPHDPRRGPGERPGAPTDRHAVGIGAAPEGHDRGQGRLLRFRRPRSEAGVRHGPDEEGHGRRRRGAGARADDHGRRAQGSSARHDPGGREQRLGRQLPPRRRADEPQGPDRGDRQHGRRGAPHPGGRPGRSRSRETRAVVRFRDLDRCRPHRSRARSRRVVHARRRAGRGSRPLRRVGFRPGVAHASLAALRVHDPRAGRRYQQCRRGPDGGVDHRGAVSGPLRRAGGRLGALRHLWLEPPLPPRASDRYPAA